MATDRYVCLSCHKGHDTPGLCPHCPQGELLDMTIPSDRELLDYQRSRQHTETEQALGILPAMLVCGAIGLSVTLLLSTQTGLSTDGAGMSGVLAMVAVLIPWLIWKDYRRQAAASEPEVDGIALETPEAPVPVPAADKAGVTPGQQSRQREQT